MLNFYKLISVHLLLTEPTPVVVDTSQDVWKNDFEPQEVSGVNCFKMHAIRTATNDFSLSNKLGQGGFGPVYKVCDILFFFSFFLFYLYVFFVL